ncbi:MAG TPA: hypothetical protein VFD84_05750 [Candidatus Binatia bacterium]|jgi:hypothetical protein|nr:hypothetical protein [Candidatus Binatia bacterium]
MDIIAALVLAEALSVTAPIPLGSPSPQSTTLPGTSISCAAVDRLAVKRCTHRRGVHLFECVNVGTGEVGGAILSNAGFVRCPVRGTVSTASGDTCATVSVCGVVATACRHDPSTLGLARCLGLL